jgi:hypothetical protein
MVYPGVTWAMERNRRIVLPELGINEIVRIISHFGGINGPNSVILS